MRDADLTLEELRSTRTDSPLTRTDSRRPARALGRAFPSLSLLLFALSLTHTPIHARSSSASTRCRTSHRAGAPSASRRARSTPSRSRRSACSRSSSARARRGGRAGRACSTVRRLGPHLCAGAAFPRGRRRRLLVVSLLLTLAPSLASQTRTSRVALRLSVLIISVHPVSHRTWQETLQCSRRFAFSFARRPPARFARRHVFRPFARLRNEYMREL